MAKSPILLPLTGVWHETSLHLEGQILLAKEKWLTSHLQEHIVKNIRRFYSLYAQKMMRGGVVRVVYRDETSWDVTIDRFGAFRLDIDIAIPEDFQPELLRFYLNGETPIFVPDRFRHDIHPMRQGAIGVISDIDDTILVTHATNFLRRMPTVLLSNAYRRREVHLMGHFYRKLENKSCDFFYVSNSEMNLYSLIRQFMEHRRFPIGPIYLRPLKKWKNLLHAKDENRHLHKIERIAFLFSLCPGKRFILVGDSGQKDPNIYHQIALEYPGRVAGILIHDIKRRVSDYTVMLNELGKAGVPVLFYRHTQEAINMISGLGIV